MKRFGSASAFVPLLLTVVFGPLLGIVLAEAAGIGLVPGVVIATAIVVFVGLTWRRTTLAVYALCTVGVMNVEMEFAGLRVGTAEIVLILVAPALTRSILYRQQDVGKFASWGAGLLIVGSSIPVLASQPFDPEVFWGFVRWTLFAVAFLGSALVIRSGSEVFRIRVSLTFVLSGVGLALLGLAQQRGLTAVVGAPALPGRPDSTFNWYSNFTQFLSLTILVGLGLLISNALTAAQKCLVLAAMFVIAPQIFGGLSRGAVLSVLGGLLILAIVSGRSARSFSLASIFVVVVALGVILFSPGQSLDALFGRLTTQQGEDFYRTSLQAAGAEVISREPWGIGLGSFESYLYDNGGLGALVPLAHPHNLFLAVAVEAGLIGLTGFAILCAGAALSSVRLARRQAPSWPVGVGGALATGGVIAQGFVDYFFYESASMVAVVVVLSLATSYGASEQSVANRQSSRARARG